MASNGKKKTTMAKLQREQRMREKRMDKQARKEARKLQDPMQADEPEVEEQPYEGPLAATPDRA